MKVKYRDIRLSRQNLVRLEQINSIIEEYQHQGLVLSLRQLYYQLVSKNVIPNEKKEYSKLSKLLKEGRMAGIVDWGAIEDRLRVPYSPSSWDGPKEAMDAIIEQYELPRMKGQPRYIEVWIEKDALSGVLKRITKRYHIPILVNRGYSSVSAMHDAFNRFSYAYESESALSIKVLYLGDHDPSGIDMIRDIEDRINEFSSGAGNDFDFSIDAIALTADQIKKFNLPKNPAKKTDPRSLKYIEEHGSASYEVDALPPIELNKILEKSILRNIDMDVYHDVVQREKEEKQELVRLRNKL